VLKILGYPDRYSVAAGETINFMISLEADGAFDAQLVRVVCGDCNPKGPGLKFRPIPCAGNGRHQGGRQTIDAGSFMRVPATPALLPGCFTFFAMVWPTLPERGEQTIAAQWDVKTGRGFRIGLVDGGKLTLTVGIGGGDVERHVVAAVMLKRQWYAIACTLDQASNSITVGQQPLRRYPFISDAASVTATLTAYTASVPGGFTLAGSPLTDGGVRLHFDGKIDSPCLLTGAYGLETYEAIRAGSDQLRGVTIAHWDFSRGIDTTRAEDIGPNELHGELVNLPTRGMKGWNWTGDVHDWQQKPEHYGAIHFHHDDLYDANWKPSVTIVVPEHLGSGPYALHVRSGPSDAVATREDFIPFFVRPPRDPAWRGARPKVAFLAPTCSYMAYANHAEHITSREAERTVGRLLQFGHADLYMYDHPELGGSLYDSHADGSGVSVSSRLRPVLNFSPRYHSWLGGHGSALWQYNADTHLFDWLDHQGVDYDVVTDEDLHAEGYDLIKDYRVILTGTHPEYHSTAMWDAMSAWLSESGRLMYLGANGWYWRVAFHKVLPGVIEVRRAEDGIRTWTAEPGEYHHSFTGELGGLWRRIGRPPNLICGVGFTAQGFDVCSYYRRAPDADHPRAAFIFEGVDDQIIGDFGLIGGGAAGLELDCITTDLGSPPNILRLASSENHSSLVMLVNEEFGVVPSNLGGDQNDRVRADLAFAETPSGGALFAVSSIAWCGSLSHNGYDNNISRITANVLSRFMLKEPFGSQ
jgi:N,N-dimethylformamidase